MAAAEPKDRRPADRGGNSDAIPVADRDDEWSAPRSAAELLASVGDDLETAIERSIEAAFQRNTASAQAPSLSEIDRVQRDTIPTLATRIPALVDPPVATGADADSYGADADARAAAASDADADADAADPAPDPIHAADLAASDARGGADADLAADRSLEAIVAAWPGGGHGRHGRHDHDQAAHDRDGGPAAARLDARPGVPARDGDDSVPESIPSAAWAPLPIDVTEPMVAGAVPEPVSTDDGTADSVPIVVGRPEFDAGPLAAALEPSEPDPGERERRLAQAHKLRKPRRYRSLVLTWLAQWLRRTQRPHIEPLPDVAPGQLSVSFAGHATVLLRYAELKVVCDPMLGRWVRGAKRAVAPGLAAADLHDVDVILISHAHRDHLHRPTLAKLPRSATLVVPPRTAHRVSDLGFARVVELGVGQSFGVRGVDIATAAVRHGSGRARGLAFVLRGDGPSAFFCGDSGYFSGFAEIGRRYRPDVALLPIGGYWPRSFRDRHMSPLDALCAFEDLQARVLVPIHHGAFTLSYEHRDDPSRWLAELVREGDLEPHVVELAPGSSRVFGEPARPQTTPRAARAPRGVSEPSSDR